MRIMKRFLSFPNGISCSSFTYFCTIWKTKKTRRAERLVKQKTNNEVAQLREDHDGSQKTIQIIAHKITCLLGPLS